MNSLYTYMYTRDSANVAINPYTVYFNPFMFDDTVKCISVAGEESALYHEHRFKFYLLNRPTFDHLLCHAIMRQSVGTRRK